MHATPSVQRSGGSPRVLRGGLGVAVVAGIAFFLAARLCIALPRDGGRLAPVWLPNAVALAFLLRQPGRRWPLIAAGAVVGNLVASTAGPNRPEAILILALSNLVEYLGAALLLRRVLHGEVTLSRGRHLALLAVVSGAAAALSSLTSSVLLWWHGDPFLPGLATWAMSHPLDLLLVTPCLLILSRWREHAAERRPDLKAGAALALLAAVDLVAFTDTAPLIFLAPAVLLLVTVQGGALGAACGVLVTAAVALPATLLGAGPIAAVQGTNLRDAVLQLFLVTCLFGALPVASLHARQRRSERDARDEAERAKAAQACAARSEAYVRLLADSAADMIARYDLDGRIGFVTPSSAAVLGYAPKEMLGRRTYDWVHPEDAPRIVAEVAAFIAAGPDAAPIVTELRARHADGSWRWLEGSPRLVRDEAGRPTQMIDVVRDITARKAMEAELRQARAEADAAAAVKARFVANMSHELRTPLTAVLGFIGLIAEQPELSEQTRGYVDRVRSGGRALLATINDVLDFSKLEAGAVELSLRPVDPRAVLDDALALLRPQAAGKGLALGWRAAPGLPARLGLDADRVRQVLLNLVGNALKFTDAGEVAVTADYDREASELVVEVADTGPGVSAEDQTRLFRRFSQVDGEGARRKPGTGLGLAICRGLVEAMGGRIGVVSAPGEGARFVFALPAVEAAPAVSPARSATAPGQGGSFRILVADGDPAARQLARLVLDGRGARVTLAEDGTAALEAARREPFDAVLLDLRLPGPDGEACARAIRDEPGPNRFASILAFTADPGPVDPLLFDGRIEKPLTAEALAQAVLEAVAPDLQPDEADARHAA